MSCEVTGTERASTHDRVKCRTDVASALCTQAEPSGHALVVSLLAEAGSGLECAVGAYRETTPLCLAAAWGQTAVVSALPDARVSRTLIPALPLEPPGPDSQGRPTGPRPLSSSTASPTPTTTGTGSFSGTEQFGQSLHTITGSRSHTRSGRRRRRPMRRKSPAHRALAVLPAQTGAQAEVAALSAAPRRFPPRGSFGPPGLPVATSPPAGPSRWLCGPVPSASTIHRPSPRAQVTTVRGPVAHCETKRRTSPEPRSQEPPARGGPQGLRSKPCSPTGAVPSPPSSSPHSFSPVPSPPFLLSPPSISSSPRALRSRRAPEPVRCPLPCRCEPLWSGLREVCRQRITGHCQWWMAASDA